MSGMDESRFAGPRRLLELARILAGPWVGQILADLGADVVKVERPARATTPAAGARPSSRARTASDLSAAYFHACNRGKRSVAVDFETPEGQALDRAARRACGRGGRELQGRRPGEIRPRLREPEGGQSAPRLLLDHRLRPERALCAARRLRLHDPGHGRHHGPDRRAGRRAAEDRRRLRRHLHRASMRSSASWRPCAGATRRGRAPSRHGAARRQAACSPTRR